MKRHTMLVEDVAVGDRYFDEETPTGAIVAGVDDLGTVVELVAVDWNRVYRRRIFKGDLVHVGIGRL